MDLVERVLLTAVAVVGGWSGGGLVGDGLARTFGTGDWLCAAGVIVGVIAGIVGSCWFFKQLQKLEKKIENEKHGRW